MVVSDEEKDSIFDYVEDRANYAMDVVSSTNSTGRNHIEFSWEASDEESEKSSSEETNGREECMKSQVVGSESKNQIVHANECEDEDSENEWIVAGCQ